MISTASRPSRRDYAPIGPSEPLDGDGDYDGPTSEGTGLLSTPSAHVPPSRSRGGLGSPAGSTSRSHRRRRHLSGLGGKTAHLDEIQAQIEKWSDKIVSTFKIRKHHHPDDPAGMPLEIQHSVFQPPDWIRPATAHDLALLYRHSAEGRMSKFDFDLVVESVKIAIEQDVHPTLISQGSSGSYFARNAGGKIVAVFKPKDEEPYATRNPKWTKWIHRNLFPFFFGRACLIPNLSYVSEAAAYVLDHQLRTNIVPYTDVVSLSSKAFHYDYWDRRAFYRRRRPLPEKQGSFQVFLKGYKDATAFFKDHPWPTARPRQQLRTRRSLWLTGAGAAAAAGGDEGGSPDDSEPSGASAPSGDASVVVEDEFWTPELQASLREQLERLVILDYIMRNTDRGLDNWMIRVDRQTKSATIVSDVPQNTLFDDADEDDDVTEAGEEQQPEAEPRTDRAVASIGAIDNSLSWPWKHPDAWRSYPFGWLFLPTTLIGRPFSDGTRRHFLPLLTSKVWWAETKGALRQCFRQDADFQEKMFAKQMAVMKGQAWNVVETLKRVDHGPLELTRRPRVCVWDDVVEVPVVVSSCGSGAAAAAGVGGGAGGGGAGGSARSARREIRSDGHGRRSTSAAPLSDGIDISSARPHRPKVNGGGKVYGKVGHFGTESGSGPDAEASDDDLASLSSDRFAFPLQTSPAPGPGSVPRSQQDGHGRSHGHGNSHGHGHDGIAAPVAAGPSTRSTGRRRWGSFGGTGPRGRGSGWESDDLAGDLGYAANENRDGDRKRVIVERLEMVKGKPPTFSWC